MVQIIKQSSKYRFQEFRIKCLHSTPKFFSTDTKQYLLYDSCHPKHIKNNIPYNLARRLCTIISDKDILNARLNELRELLKQRHYPTLLIEKGIDNAKLHDRNSLLQIQEKPVKNLIPYVSTHNPKNQEFFQVIKTNMPILENDPRMKDVFSEFQLIKSKRQSPSLKKILTRAKFNNTEETAGVKKCHHPRCGTCPFLQESEQFIFKNGRKFVIHSSFICESSNLIYVMTCSGCGEHYIGQTGETIRHRMTVHRQQIRQTEYQCTAVSGHIRTCAENIFPNFTVFPIYKFYNKTSEKERETKEKHFISLFKPKLNALS